ncbi:hypothetical protein B0H12DRAFT_1078145 [Mycena haematopus]|nr:hypothetical protein B0H12DRAFT_1078145 [Mycena haematopus]
MFSFLSGKNSITRPKLSYSSHADEILAILLSICESAMVEDSSYFPLNLTSYLTTQKLSESRVVQKCNTLWLCACLTVELVARENHSPLLSGPVADAMWEVAFMMARQYLDSWAYRSNPSAHLRALESVRSAATSRASTSTIALIQTNILNAVSPLPHDFDNMEAVNTIAMHPILPKDNDRVLGDEPMLSILSMRVVILTNFVGGCIGDQLAYNAIDTAHILTDFLPRPPGVEAIHQVHFAPSWSALFSQGSSPLLLETLAKGKLLSAYWDGPKTWVVDTEYRWLGHPLAAQIFAESLTAYLQRVPDQLELGQKLTMMKHSFAN